MTDRTDTWDGGYRRTNSHGKKVYVIYRRVRGKLYEISTRCTSSAAAAEQYRRFQADPESYKPEGDKPRGALLLTTELGDQFLAWSRHTKRNTAKWVRDQKRALAWWQDRIDRVDLRALSTERVVAELARVPGGRKQLIATLKTFYAWLRTERHAITTAEDPTYGQIRVPQAKPKQLTRVKAVTRAEFDRVLADLTGWHRDALTVLGATGWHWTELERFASGGAVESHPRSGRAVLLCPHTKGGVPLRTEVSGAARDSARRLRERSTVDYFEFRNALRATGATFNPGYLRHSVATAAINAGADPAQVAAFLGHRSPATTKKFYATHSVPARVPTMGED